MLVSEADFCPQHSRKSPPQTKESDLRMSISSYHKDSGEPRFHYPDRLIAVKDPRI